MSGALLGRIMEMSLVGSYSILLVLAVRLLLKRCERKYSYYLWVIVFLNLCLPFSFRGNFSLIPQRVSDFKVEEISAAGWVAENGFLTGTEAVAGGNGAYAAPEAGAMQGETKAGQEISGENAGAGSVLQEMAARLKAVWKAQADGARPGAGQKAAESLRVLWLYLAPALEALWAAGIALILLVNLYHIFRVKKAVSPERWESWDAKRRIAEIEELPAPFLWGIVRPVIMLPAGLSKEERKYIAAHEMCHRRRKDPAVKAVVFCVAALHWFNPLVWLAWSCFCRDMEISCDEAVLSRSKKSIKKQYAQSLLKYAARQNGYLVTPLTFGEPSVKRRIKNVLRFRKRNVVTAVIAGICVLLVAIGLFVRPAGKPADESALDASAEDRDSSGNEAENMQAQYWIETDETGAQGAGIYRYDSQSGAAELVVAGSFARMQEDDSYLYVSRREEEHFFFDSVRKEDGALEKNLTGQAIEAEAVTSFYADENYILYGAGQYEGSAGTFHGAFYSYDRRTGAFIEKRLTDADGFAVADGHVYYQRYWNQGGADSQLFRVSFTLSGEEQVGDGLTFLLWDQANGELIAQKGERAEVLMRVDPDGKNERVLMDASALFGDMEQYDKIRFQDARIEGAEIFASAELWGYREENQEQYGWRDSLLKSVRLQIHADGSGFDVLEGQQENGEGTETSGAEAFAGRLIESQTFQLNLAPIGQVTFASYEPDAETNPNGDATFSILKDGQAVCTLPEVFEGNVRPGNAFYAVEAVSFPDINQDGYDDIIIICQYVRGAGPEAGEVFSEARIYTGTQQGTFELQRKMMDAANSALATVTVQTVRDFLGVGQTEPAELQGWQQAYIERLKNDDALSGYGGYDLIWLDDDDIPELVEIGDSEAAGCRIVSFYDEKLTVTQLNRLNFSYLVREGLLCNSEGNMDNYYDLVYRLSGGNMTVIAEGYYGAADNSHVEFDESGEPVYQYEWNGQKMSREEYEKALNAVYDTSRGKTYAWPGISAEEMIKQIEGME